MNENFRRTLKEATFRGKTLRIVYDDELYIIYEEYGSSPTGAKWSSWFISKQRPNDGLYNWGKYLAGGLYKNESGLQKEDRPWLKYEFVSLEGDEVHFRDYKGRDVWVINPHIHPSD